MTGYQFYLDGGFRHDADGSIRRRHICVLDGDKMKPRYTTKERSGGNGFGLATENVSFTVTVRDRHMVGVFG